MVPAPFEVGTLFPAQGGVPFAHWSVCSLPLLYLEKAFGFCQGQCFNQKCIDPARLLASMSGVSTLLPHGAEPFAGEAP